MRRSAALWIAVAAASIGGVALAAITRIDEAATVGEQAERIRDARPSVGGCHVFPADNAWNRRVDTDPLRADSDAIIATIQANGGTRLHPDFGENPDYPVPWYALLAQVLGPLSLKYSQHTLIDPSMSFNYRPGGHR